MKKRVLSMMLALLLCMALFLPAYADTDLPEAADADISLGEIELVKNGQPVPDAFPDGVSYDAASAVLTLNRYVNPAAELLISSDSDQAAVTLQLVGENTLK